MFFPQLSGRRACRQIAALLSPHCHFQGIPHPNFHTLYLDYVTQNPELLQAFADPRLMSSHFVRVLTTCLLHSPTVLLFQFLEIPAHMQVIFAIPRCLTSLFSNYFVFHSDLTTWFHGHSFRPCNYQQLQPLYNLNFPYHPL